MSTSVTSKALLVVLSLAVSDNTLFGQNRQGDVTDFSAVSANVARAWAEYEKALPTLQVDTEFKRYDQLKDGVLVEHMKHTLRVKGNEFLVGSIQTLVDPKAGKSAVPVTKASGTNPHYGFDVRRKGDGPWSLVNVTDLSENKDPNTTGKYDVGFKMKHQPYAMHYETEDNQPLSELLQSPSFRLLECRPSPDNPQWVRVHGERPSADPKNPKKAKFSGWFDLDPDAGWCIRAAEQRLVYPGWVDTLRSMLDVTVGTNGVPLLDRIRYEVKTEAGGKVKYHGKTDWTYQYRIDANVPDKEFTLTAFGLPEPPGFEKRPTRWYLWIGLTGTVCLILGAAVYWLKQRKVGGA